MLSKFLSAPINPCKTLVDTESKLGADGDPVSDPTLYQSFDEPHLTALKRILRYVHETIDHGLQLHVSSTNQLTAYTNVDLVGTLSRSSAEAEYRGVTNVFAEIAWVRTFCVSFMLLCLLLHLFIVIIFWAGARVMFPARVQLAEFFSLTIIIHIYYGLNYPALYHFLTSLAISWLFSEPRSSFVFQLGTWIVSIDGCRDNSFGILAPVLKTAMRILSCHS
ncbi:ribonuclease H-like domain-containing protein [Tanacetum coccineum]